MGPVAARHGQAGLEGIERERAVDVQVAEQDLLRARHTGIECAGPLPFRASRDHGGVDGARPRLARRGDLDAESGPEGVQEHQRGDPQDRQGDRDSNQHGILPDRATRRPAMGAGSGCNRFWGGMGEMRGHRGAFVVALGLWLGCATTPASQQSWVEVQTPHFRILSALSRPKTHALALDLELFRRGVALLAGEDLPVGSRRVQVFAFDDRRLARFLWGARRAYLLPAPDGPTIVLRAGAGWRGDADVKLRHDLAHVLLRGRDGLTAPLWYDEGLAQLASTLEVQDRAATLGGVRDDHLSTLRTGERIPVLRLLDLESFDGRDGPRRRRFEAESWGLAHYLFFSARAPRHLPSQLLALAAVGQPDDALVEQTLGMSVSDLDQELAHYPSRAQDGSLEIRAHADAASPPRARPLARSEVLVELGELALALGRSEQARRQFEAALGSEAQAARVHAGLAACDAFDGRFAQSERQLEAALALAEPEARVERHAADVWLAHLAIARDGDERLRYAERARTHYQRSLERERAQAGAHAGIAVSHLAENDLPAAMASLDRAERINPASLDLRVMRARLLLAAGDSDAARTLARTLRARLHVDGADLRAPGAWAPETVRIAGQKLPLSPTRTLRPGSR
jgi:tetratricopeptide (TPR) repeat protein